MNKHEKKHIESTADRLLKFMSGLKSTLEGYKINRLEHSLQSATRALQNKAEDVCSQMGKVWSHSGCSQWVITCG